MTTATYAAIKRLSAKNGFNQPLNKRLANAFDYDDDDDDDAGDDDQNISCG